MKPKHQRLIFILIGLAVLALGVTLLLQQFRSNLLFFYSPSEVQAQAIPAGKKMRVGGLVEEGSVLREEKSLDTRFVITDGKASLTISYHGIVPALFREGQGMIAKGSLDAEGVFIADELLAKHDETYMPPEVAEALKKSGHWKGK